MIGKTMDKQQVAEGGKLDVDEDLDLKRYRELLCEYAPKPIYSLEEFESTHQQLTALSQKTRTNEEKTLASLLLILCRTFEDDYYRDTPPERLRRFMDRVGRKQAELAAATGIPDSTISAMLAGTRQISKDCAVRLAEHFGVSVQHFIKGAKAAKKGRAT